jgi:hypothetical protein
MRDMQRLRVIIRRVGKSAIVACARVGEHESAQRGTAAEHHDRAHLVGVARAGSSESRPALDIRATAVREYCCFAMDLPDALRERITRQISSLALSERLG